MTFSRFIPKISTPLRVPTDHGLVPNLFQSPVKLGTTVILDSSAYEGHVKQRRIAATSLDSNTAIVAFRKFTTGSCRLIAVSVTNDDQCSTIATLDFESYSNVEWLDIVAISEKHVIIRFEVLGSLNLYLALVTLDGMALNIMGVSSYNKGNTLTGGSLTMLTNDRGIVTFNGMNNLPTIIGFSVAGNVLNFDESETEIYDEVLESNSPIPVVKLNETTGAVFWNSANKIQRGAVCNDQGNNLMVSSIIRLDSLFADYVPLVARIIEESGNIILGSSIGRNIGGANISLFNHASALCMIEQSNQVLIPNQNYKPQTILHPMNGFIIQETIRGNSFGLGVITDDLQNNLLLCPFGYSNGSVFYGMPVPIWEAAIENIMTQNTTLVSLTKKMAVVFTAGRSVIGKVIRRR